jgi:hypothetical protein
VQDRDCEESVKHRRSSLTPAESRTFVEAILTSTGWNQSELARRSSLDSATICRIVQGKQSLGRGGRVAIEHAIREADVAPPPKVNTEALVRTLAGLYAARDADPPSVWVADRGVYRALRARPRRCTVRPFATYRTNDGWEDEVSPGHGFFTKLGKRRAIVLTEDGARWHTWLLRPNQQRRHGFARADRVRVVRCEPRWTS